MQTGIALRVKPRFERFIAEKFLVVTVPRQPIRGRLRRRCHDLLSQNMRNIYVKENKAVHLTDSKKIIHLEEFNVTNVM